MADREEDREKDEGEPSATGHDGAGRAEADRTGEMDGDDGEGGADEADGPDVDDEDDGETSGDSADEEELEELYEEVDQLRARVSELEEELARGRRESSSRRWWTWILGTFAAASALALIVIFLGHGFPAPAGPTAQGGDSSEQRQQEALFALLNEHADELQSCFDRWVISTRAEPGTIVRTLIEVEAAEDGTVTRVDVTGEDVATSFSDCLGAAVRAWAFPAGGGRFALEAPFEVQGAAGGAADADGAGAASGSTDGGDR